MAWWAPGSQSASRIGRGQVRARPTAKVVTPAEPPADVRRSIAIFLSPARVAYQGNSILSGQHGNCWCGSGVDIDIDQDRRTVSSWCLIDDATDENAPCQLVAGGTVGRGRHGNEPYLRGRQQQTAWRSALCKLQSHGRSALGRGCHV